MLMETSSNSSILSCLVYFIIWNEPLEKSRANRPTYRYDLQMCMKPQYLKCGTGSSKAAASGHLWKVHQVPFQIFWIRNYILARSLNDLYIYSSLRSTPIKSLWLGDPPCPHLKYFRGKNPNQIHIFSERDLLNYYQDFILKHKVFLRHRWKTCPLPTIP